MKLSEAINEPHVGYHKLICFNKVLTQAQLDSFISTIETNANLKLHADPNILTSQTLHGFVTAKNGNGTYCDWGEHNILNPHTCIIISLYKINKPDDLQEITVNGPNGPVLIEVGNINIFQSVNITQDLKNILTSPNAVKEREEFV